MQADQYPELRGFDRPAFERFLIDHQLARIGVFASCLLTIGVFYLAIVKLPISRMFPAQQLQQLGNTLSFSSPSPLSPQIAANLDTSSPAPAAPTAVLSAPASTAPAPASASASAKAAPSSSASSAPAAVTPAPTPPPAPTATAAASPAPSSKSYTVQPGDTLFSIGRRFNVSAQELATLNRIPDSGLVKAGEKLKVP